MSQLGMTRTVLFTELRLLIDGPGLRDYGPLARWCDTHAERLVELETKAAKYDALNTPELVDFLAAVEREALHQRERWAASGDAGKSDADWFWLLGYLGGKALHSGDRDPAKRLHHIVTTAAACLNWHAARVGTYTAMRPGTDQS